MLRPGSSAPCRRLSGSSQAGAGRTRPMTALRAALPACLAVTLGLAVPAAVAGTSPPPSQLAPIHGPYAPTIAPANFVSAIDNRFLPFVPGTAFHYEGESGTTPQTDDEVVTHRTRRILG